MQAILDNDVIIYAQVDVHSQGLQPQHSTTVTVTPYKEVKFDEEKGEFVYKNDISDSD